MERKLGRDLSGFPIKAVAGWPLPLDIVVPHSNPLYPFPPWRWQEPLDITQACTHPLVADHTLAIFIRHPLSPPELSQHEHASCSSLGFWDMPQSMTSPRLMPLQGWAGHHTCHLCSQTFNSSAKTL